MKPLYAVTVVAGFLAVSALMLDNWQNLGLPLEATRWMGYFYVMLIHLSPVLVYLLVFRHTDKFLPRLGLSFIPLSGWWLSELALRLRWHSLAESIWLLISPFFLLQLALALGLIGVTHLVMTLATGARPRIIASLGYAAVVLPVTVSAPFSLGFFLKGYQSVFQPELLPVPSYQPGRLDPASVSSSTEESPNIVFILSDDHRHDFTGYAGPPFVETPGIDRLAEEGIVFNRAYVSTSLCSPSRASFLTGVSPHQHGVSNNFTPWSEHSRQQHQSH